MSMLTFSGIVLAFLAYIMQRCPEEDPVKTINSSQVLDTYDFIIVGGGSAGKQKLM